MSDNRTIPGARPGRRNAAPQKGPAPSRTAARTPARRPAPALPGRLLGWFGSADHRLTAAKLLLVIALIIYTGRVIASTTARDVDFSLIAQRFEERLEDGELYAGDASAFQDRFGLEPEGLEGWLIYISDDMMNVSELLIAKASDAAARDRLEDAAQRRLEAQLDAFRGYGTNQTALLEDALLWQRGDYLFYGVSETVDQWEEIFLSCIR